MAGPVADHGSCHAYLEDDPCSPQLRYLSSNRFASGSERSYGRHQPKEAVMTNVVLMSRPPGVVISNGAITGARDQLG